MFPLSILLSKNSIRHVSRAVARAVTALALCVGGVATAQILTPQGYPGQCRLAHQEALAIQHDGKQSLVLEARYEFVTPQRPRTTQAYRARAPREPQVELQPPDKLVWVLPVPPGCASLDAPSDTLFEELYDWLHPSIKANYGLRTGRPTAFSRFGGSLFSPAAAAAPRGHAPAWMVFPTSGEAALTSLVEWCSSNGMQGLDTESARDYARRGWTFAIGTVETPGLSGTLGPTHLVFPTPEIVFPLRFQARAGTQDFTFYAVTAKDLSTRGLYTLRLSPLRGITRLSREGQSRGYVTLASLAVPGALQAHLDSVRSGGLPGLPADSIRLYAWKAGSIPTPSRRTSTPAPDLVIPEKVAPAPRAGAAPRSTGTYRRR
ncbi:MAG: DUF2330 domain-containing protein [Candidatus Omnitrophica bacterium]|nr:hypothetical protein [bacterium]NUN97262.1 DUF2330 domain-containing protein [Candidatus Omnitrophota bacterium]